MRVVERTLYVCDRCNKEDNGYTLKLPLGWHKPEGQDLCRHCYTWQREANYQKAVAQNQANTRQINDKQS